MFNPARFGLGARAFSSFVRPMDKYYKILRYTKPIDTTVYKAGDAIPKGVRVPKYKKLEPEYAYETTFFKRQNRGLFGGLQRTSSKSCSANGKNKNLRTHLPNIVKTKLWSETLNKLIQTHVTTTVLRTITKEGGLDKYLTKDKPARIKTLGLKGWKLRYQVLKAREAEKLGSKDGKKIYYVHPTDGKQITVGRGQLLRELYPLVYKDSYHPIEWKHFVKHHTVLTTQELVEKLESYNYDFSPITV